MAETKKKRGPGRPPGSKNKVDHAAAPNKKEQIDEMQRKYDRDRRNVDVIWSITLAAIGLFLFFSIVMTSTGSVGEKMQHLCLGLFGRMAYALPFFVLIFAILLLAGKLQHIGWRTILFSFLIFVNICVLNSYGHIDGANPSIGFGDMADHYTNAISGIGGGVIGMEIGGLLVKFFGKPGLIIIALAVIIISVFLVANTPISRFVENTIKKREEKKILAEMNEKYRRDAELSGSAAMPEPVAAEKRKGARTVDMQDTIVMSAEEFRLLQQQEEERGIIANIKSVWRSLVGGLSAGDSDIAHIPNKSVRLNTEDLNSYQDTSIPKPFGKSSGTSFVKGTSKDTADMDPVRGNAAPLTSAQSRVIVKDNSSEIAGRAETERDTLFGRLTKRFTDYVSGSSKEREPQGADEDYGYPGDRKRTQQSAASGTMKPRYGLADTQELGHSGVYGLDGHTIDGGKAATASLAGANAAGVGIAQSFEESKEKRAKAAEANAAANNDAKKPAKSKNTTKKEAPAETTPRGKTLTDEEAAKLAAGFSNSSEYESYELPPVSLLKRGSGPRHMMSAAQIGEHAELLEKTLNDFGVDAKVINVTQGASVTRYEVQPATGVKVSRIVNLADDIALNMRAKTVRIEAPIPGKAAVGIEIENKEASPVLIRELIDSEEFRDASSKIEFVVGKDISGNNIVADMKEMPHLLVAGATGSGKSVCINSIITSFLYKAKPSELKLIMIDPKMVELGNYNGIPHMLTPVVTDPRKAARALAIAVDEMEKRYEAFAKDYVKNLESYNEKMRSEGRYADCKPEIIIIIDELADLMMAAPNDVENAICRLAQKARAAGMHLIVATQRPSVDVVTGLIKANVPSRIAFTTTSSIDSRTILDTTGAEKLLGKGDMLFSPVGSTKPLRVQGPFISAEEIEKIIKFVKKEGGDPEYDEELQSAIDNLDSKGAAEPQDELTEDAIAFIFKSGQASVSMLQRRFRIGYNRAARIIDEIEDKGIIGPQDGARPRQLLISEDMYYGGLGDADAEAVEEDVEEAPAEHVSEPAELYEEPVVAPAQDISQDAEPEEEILEETFDDVLPDPELENDPVLNELVYGESYDDTPVDYASIEDELEAEIALEESSENTMERTLHIKPEEPEPDIMDPADDGKFNTGVNAFKMLSPEQQAKILDADYEDDY